MENNCNKLLKELESNVKLLTKKIHLKTEDYETALQELLKINDIKNLRLSTPISMSNGMIIVHQTSLNNLIEIKGLHSSKEYFKNTYNEANRLYKLGGKHFTYYNENINNIMPTNPCLIYENDSATKNNYYKKLCYIVINRTWLVDYSEVAKSLNDIREEVKHCLDKDIL